MSQKNKIVKTPVYEVQLFLMGNNGFADNIFYDLSEGDIFVGEYYVSIQSEDCMYYFAMNNIKEMRVIEDRE